MPAAIAATPFSASPRLAPSSTLPSGIISAPGSLHRTSPKSPIFRKSSATAALPPDRHDFCPSYRTPDVTASDCTRFWSWLFTTGQPGLRRRLAAEPDVWARPLATSVGKPKQTCLGSPAAAFAITRSWPMGVARHPNSRIAALPSHRLERAVELHIDQHRHVIVERLADQVGRVVNRLGAFGRDAERTRQADEVDRRIEEFHPHISVDLLGVPAQPMEALLEDAIGRVVEDHEHDRNAIMRSC